MEKERMSFNLEVGKKNTLKEMAKERGITLTALLTLMIHEYIQKNKKKGAK